MFIKKALTQEQDGEFCSIFGNLKNVSTPEQQTSKVVNHIPKNPGRANIFQQKILFYDITNLSL